MTHTDNLPGVPEEPTPSESMLTDGLAYVSKSRIKTQMTCPRKFFWKYVCETRPPGSIHTERGSEVHRAYEVFHENLLDHIEAHGEMPDRFTDLLGDRRDWQQWIEYIGEFFRFELRRLSALDDKVSEAEEILSQPINNRDELILNQWKPVEVEAEAWLGPPPDSWIESDRGGAPNYVSGEPPVGDIPWMGRADLIVDSRSLPEVQGDGVTIIDYKTGTAPTVKHEGKPWLERTLQEGIFLEGEYYGWLFENHMDVDAVAGYYPRNDEFIVSTYPNKDRRRDIKAAVLAMQRAPEKANFGIDQSGLCHWDNANGEGQCHFHSVCETRHDCTHCGTDGAESATSGAGRYD